MTQFTSGVFYDAQTANEAVNAIVAMDYPRDRINVVLSPQTRRRFWEAASHEQQTINVTETGSSDDIIGSLLAGGATGGPKRSTAATNDAETVIVVGPVAAALASDGADARGSSGALEVLNRLGLPQVDAERLRREIKSGAIVVGVSTSDGDRAAVERAMRANAARNVMETATRG